jgi:hypothetical protein
MKLLASWGLRLLTALTSVFIAACYGIPYDRGLRGRVIDSGTQAPIPAIDVSCLDEVGAVLERTSSGAEGEFTFAGFCTQLAAEDVDGAANGTWAAKTVPADADYVVVPLDPLPE